MRYLSSFTPTPCFSAWLLPVTLVLIALEQGVIVDHGKLITLSFMVAVVIWLAGIILENPSNHTDSPRNFQWRAIKAVIGYLLVFFFIAEVAQTANERLDSGKTTLVTRKIHAKGQIRGRNGRDFYITVDPLPGYDKLQFLAISRSEYARAVPNTSYITLVLHQGGIGDQWYSKTILLSEPPRAIMGVPR